MESDITHYSFAEIKVSYVVPIKASKRTKITRSVDAEAVFRAIWSDNIELKEEFYIILLNRGNYVLGWHMLSQGGLAGTIVDLRLVFSIALKGLASGIVIAHNHPSGNPSPSSEDIKLTNRLKEAGKILEIPILDHIIITSEEYHSFADNGML